MVHSALAKLVLCRRKTEERNRWWCGLVRGWKRKKRRSATARKRYNARRKRDRRKKRLKGNQIEIPRRQYQGCSRYGVYKWKAMNRWIRGKEIKAEAEWTARWVFRYDKSPRKSLRSFFVSFFSVFSAHLASFRIRTRPLLPSPYLIFLPPPRPFSFVLVPFFSLIFFIPTVLVEEKSRATFRLSDLYPRREDRGVRREHSHAWISPRQSSRCHSQLAKSRDSQRYSEISTPPADRVSPACRFKTTVEIVDFNISNRLYRALPPVFYLFKFTIYICNASRLKTFSLANFSIFVFYNLSCSNVTHLEYKWY